MATLLTIENLSKAYDKQVIFDNAGLALAEKQKVGMIGRNGAGKSTLLRIISGEEQADSGSIIIHDITRLGYLKQQDELDLDAIVIDYLIENTGKEIWQCAKMASRFDIKKEKLSLKIEALSGGYRMRLKLVIMLLKEPNLFLLDEPTNYLDVHTQLLLENVLKNYSGAFVIVSHDREFLKRTCEQTLEVEKGKIYLFPRPIDEYLEYKKQRLLTAEMYNKKIDREQKHLQTFVDRFRYKSTKARQAQSKMKAIERLEKVEIDSPMANVRINIRATELKRGLILRLENLAIGYGDKLIADKITLDVDRKQHIAIIGDNGQGKTTLLKTLASELEPLAGRFKWAYDIQMGYYAQHIADQLDPKDKVWRYLRRQATADIFDGEVMKMAGNFLFRDDDLEKEVSMLSGGERARLCLAGLLLEKNTLLLLDEPTSHLDFETVEALGLALEDFVGTVLFVSHNRTFVNSVANGIIEVKNGMARLYPGSYEDYIYHLEQDILKQEVDEGKTEVSFEGELPTQKMKPFEELRAIRKTISKVENDLHDLEKEKTKLLRKQSKNPLKFSSSEYQKLGEIIQQVEDKEKEWLELQL
ncbi:MAG: ABC-F family ATP-binding cassette domain-containing protein [bacterium]|nr:ABC-F family ATP-binding cassette domain-containing protein [bacterium]